MALFIIIFFWLTKIGVFMVILHPWAGYQSNIGSSHSSQSVWGGQPSPRIPTNGLLRVAELELGVLHEASEPYPLSQAPVGYS